MVDPSHTVVLEGAPAYLAEVQGALERSGIRAEIVGKPGGATNT